MELPRGSQEVDPGWPHDSASGDAAGVFEIEEGLPPPAASGARKFRGVALHLASAALGAVVAVALYHFLRGKDGAVDEAGGTDASTGTAGLDRLDAADKAGGAVHDCGMGFDQGEAAVARRLPDWGAMNHFPPWRTNIEQGSQIGVALVLGQALKPDGTPSRILTDRAKAAKKLYDDKKVSKVIVSGGDAEDKGTTEACFLSKFLIEGHFIPKGDIIREHQAMSTAEQIWFGLRWLPEHTGKLYIVTSEFHMARSIFIVNQVLYHFYTTMEQQYKYNDLWKSDVKTYPRLEVIQQPAQSTCGTDATQNQDANLKADGSELSLARRAADELRFLGSGEVPSILLGEEADAHLWPIPLDVMDVNGDVDGPENFRKAIWRALQVAKALCKCKAPAEDVATSSTVEYPEIPEHSTLPEDDPKWNNAWSEEDWIEVKLELNKECPGSYPLAAQPAAAPKP